MGFFSSLTGSSQREDARYGMQWANRHLNAARDQVIDDTHTGLDLSLGYLNPSIDGGNRARELYENALGVNGLPAQRDYYSDFQNDPGFQAELDYGLDQTQRSAAARGSMYSGRTLGALADRAQMHQRGAFNDRLDRLSGLSQLGQQASGQAAGLTTNAYNRIGDTKFGTAQLRANNVLGYSNAAAQSKTAGANNLLGLGSAVGGSVFGGGSGGGLSQLSSLFAGG